MRLITIGTGNRGAVLADLIAKKGIRVNRVPLFKCFAVSNEVDLLRTLKTIPAAKRFHVWGKSLHDKDVMSIINSILSYHEIYEGFLVLTSLDEEFGHAMSVELCRKLMKISEEPVISLGILPNLDRANLFVLKERIMELRKACDVLIIFEEGENTDPLILDSLNTISMVGEIDIRKRTTGEVVVDTSDVINSMKKEGISVIGVSERKLPLWPIRKYINRNNYEIKGLKARRMMEMCEEAINSNVSSNIDIESASSALIVFSGDPEEITMDGMFSCIGELQKVNPFMEIRYGDYPIKTNKLTAVVLLSGIKKLKF
jgi:cell division GTPase FtsZ